MATQAITFLTAGVTVNKNFIAPLTLLKSDNSEFQYRSLKALKQDLDPYLDAGYAIEGGVLHAYQRSAGALTVLNTPSAGTFYYIKSDRKDTTTGAATAVNVAPDTTINPTWFNFIKEYAAYRLALIKASGEFLEKAVIYKRSADAILAPTKV